MEQNKLFSREALDKLRSPEKLDNLLHITNPISWMGLIAVLLILLSVFLWSVFGSVIVRADGMGTAANSSGVLYVPLETGMCIEPGMPVQLSTSGADAPKSSNLTAFVTSVSPYPVSAKDMSEKLGNEELAQFVLQREGTVVEVRYDLENHEDNVSESGFVTGFVIIENTPPIEKVFYKLNQWLGSR